MKKYLILLCCVFGFTGPAQGANMASQKASPVTVYLNQALAKLFKTDDTKCTRFTCGSEKISWEQSLKCALLNKLHPNCVKQIVAELKAIDAGKITKGLFFKGEQALPPEVRDFFLDLLEGRLQGDEAQMQLARDILYGTRQLISNDTLDAWKQSGATYLAQIDEAQAGRFALGQVLKSNDPAVKEGTLFIIHADKAGALNMQKNVPTYVTFSTFVNDKKAQAIIKPLGQYFPHLKPTHAVVNFRQIT